MAVENLQEKLAKIAIPDTSWLKKAKWRKENREWLMWSARIAVKILFALDEKKMTKADLARKMNVSPQRITTILKGQENFTLDTITKIEKVLGIDLQSIPKTFKTEQVKLTEMPVKDSTPTKVVIDTSALINTGLLNGQLTGAMAGSLLVSGIAIEAKAGEYNYAMAA